MADEEGVAGVELPDGTTIGDHIGRDITVVVAGQPPASVRELVEASMAAGRAIKVVRTASEDVRRQLGARIVVLDTSAATVWSGDDAAPAATTQLFGNAFAR